MHDIRLITTAHGRSDQRATFDVVEPTIPVLPPAGTSPPQSLAFPATVMLRQFWRDQVGHAARTSRWLLIRDLRYFVWSCRLSSDLSESQPDRRHCSTSTSGTIVRTNAQGAPPRQAVRAATCAGGAGGADAAPESNHRRPGSSAGVVRALEPRRGAWAGRCPSSSRHWSWRESSARRATASSARPPSTSALTTLVLDQGLAAASSSGRSLHRDLPGAVATVNLASAAVLLAGLTWLVAPAVADFFSAPDLAPLLRVLGLGLLLKGLAITPRAVQQRELAFTADRQWPTSVAGCSGRPPGITAALLGAGTWSMAVQVLTTDLVIAIALLAVTRGARPNLRLRPTAQHPAVQPSHLRQQRPGLPVPQRRQHPDRPVSRCRLAVAVRDGLSRAGDSGPDDRTDRQPGDLSDVLPAPGAAGAARPGLAEDPGAAGLRRGSGHGPGRGGRPGAGPAGAGTGVAGHRAGAHGARHSRSAGDGLQRGRLD